MKESVDKLDFIKIINLFFHSLELVKVIKYREDTKIYIVEKD